VSLSPIAVAIQGLNRSPRLVAVQGLWPDFEEEPGDETSAFGTHRGRHWRPGELEPLDILPPRKRPRRRRREELFVIGS
jgi:hypothetical protein